MIIKNPLTVIKGSAGGTPPSPTGYVRPTGVPNGEEIIANAPDIEQGGVVYKPIYYICAMDTFNSATFGKTADERATGADAYVFSDEPSTLYVGTSVAHTFDATSDYTTSEGWKCRYIIMYATAANKAYWIGITVNLYSYSTTFEMIGASGTMFSSTTALFGRENTACKSINYVDISRCSFYGNSVSADYFMGNNSALKEIKLPESVERVTGDYFCQSSSSLTALSSPNLTRVTGANFCYYCSSLTSLSLPNLTEVAGDYFCQSSSSLTALSSPNLTEVSGKSFCANCSSLAALSLPNLTEVSGNSFCQSCYSLTSLSLPNLTRVTGAYFCYYCSSLFYMNLSAVTILTSTSATTLSFCRYITLPTDFDISAVNFSGVSNDYTKSLDWLNNELPTKLKDNSGGTAKTMALGAANIALIGTTAAAIIAAKNWTIA